MIEKRLVTVHNGDIIDISTGEVITAYRYDAVELEDSNMIWQCGDDRNAVFEFRGYK